jgi:hypothetical protein
MLARVIKTPNFRINKNSFIIFRGVTSRQTGSLGETNEHNFATFRWNTSGQSGIRFPVEASGFFLLRSFHTAPVSQAVSYRVGTAVGTAVGDAVGTAVGTAAAPQGTNLTIRLPSNTDIMSECNCT